MHSRATKSLGGPVVALPLHGGAHSDDLAVQAFARHLTSVVTTAGGNGQPIIAGMRAFLEGKPQLLPEPPWNRTPPTGYRAVEQLAAAAGCDADDIARARLASRHDLAGSAWILDPADGLADLVDRAGWSRVVVFADPDDPATEPVLDALELPDHVDVIDGSILARTLGTGPAVLIDTSWTPRLADAHRAGHTTALIDRFGSGDGRPDLRADDLAGLLPGIADWLAALPTTAGARP